MALLLIIFCLQRIAPSPYGPILPHPVEYASYQIIDDATGKPLTYISVPVTIGDEYVTDDNRRFVVVRVKKNKAFARYAGKVKLRF